MLRYLLSRSFFIFIIHQITTHLLSRHRFCVQIAGIKKPAHHQQA